jgi:ketosteroid isomerase-like protein
VVGDAEIVRGWFAHAEGRLDDADTLAYWYEDVWDPEIDWRAIQGAPDDSGVMRGRDRVRAYFEELQEAFENIVVRPLELVEVGECVVADMHFVGRSRGAGVPTELRFAMTYLVKDGRLTSGREYLTREEAIAAASLRLA